MLIPPRKGKVAAVVRGTIKNQGRGNSSLSTEGKTSQPRLKVRSIMRRSHLKNLRLLKSRPREGQNRLNRLNTDPKLQSLKIKMPVKIWRNLKWNRRRGIDPREPLPLSRKMLLPMNLKTNQGYEQNLGQELLHKWSTNARMRLRRSIKMRKKLRVKISLREASLKVVQTRDANIPSMTMRNPLSLRQHLRSTEQGTGVDRGRRRSTLLWRLSYLHCLKILLKPQMRHNTTSSRLS